MKLTQIILILAILIVSQGCESEIPAVSPAMGNAFELHGYKSVKFRMPIDQLEDLGYECEEFDIPDMPDMPYIDCSSINDETLFGKPAVIMVDIEEGKVSEITIATDHLSKQELIELYQKSLGKPKMKEFEASGGTIQTYYWISAQGTSISLSLYLDKNPDSTSFVNYNSVAATSKLLKRRAQPIDMEDF